MKVPTLVLGPWGWCCAWCWACIALPRWLIGSPLWRWRGRERYATGEGWWGLRGPLFRRYWLGR